MDPLLQKLTLLNVGFTLASFLGVWAVNKLRKAGAFQLILFDEKPVPSHKVFVVKSYKGKYGDAHLAFRALFETVKGNTGADNTVGIYYDDPKIAGTDNCRYSVGLCLTSEQQNLIKLLEAAGYKRVQIEKNLNALHCSFPFTGILSVLLAVQRVYGACDKELEKRKLKMNKESAVLEITFCPSHEGVTEYYFMLDASQELSKMKSEIQ
jgi:hypothetical protein